MKVIKINSCVDCPCIFWVQYPDRGTCKEMKYRHVINADWGVPDWCPLDDDDDCDCPIRGLTAFHKKGCVNYE